MLLDKRVSCIVGGVLLASMPLSRALAFDPPPFPRVAATTFGGPRDYQSSSVQNQLAKFDIALMGPWFGWEKGRSVSLETVVRNIKAKNPNELVFFYNVINEISLPDPGDKRSIADAANSNGWWLYQNGGSGNIVKSTWGDSFYLLNTTNFAPKNSSGVSYLAYRADWQIANVYALTPSIDGFITDNVTWKPRVNGDWNRDGVTDNQDSPTVQAWFRQGYRTYIDLLKAKMPGKYQGGNIDWGVRDAVFPELQGQLNLGFNEGMIGYSWSFETWGGWTEMMRAYRKMLGALAAPKIEIFAQVGNASDYQAMRYGLTSCLMDDGYYTFNTSSSYGDMLWFDEYDSNLGAATSSPATTAWQKGVYRRDFESGIALVNPKGNGRQTVVLETTFKKLTGSQASSVNSGAAVTSVTLQDRDGIILLRNGAAAKSQSKPASPKSVVVE